MKIWYFFSDYDSVTYLCDDEADKDSFKIIKSRDDLNTITDNDYLYCILPTNELCLFRNTNHSAGSCGQPIISAGHVIIKDTAEGILRKK